MSALDMSYRAARLEALSRDGRRCLVCGGLHDLTTHHKVPRHVSRDDRAENLATLCRGCHDLIEQLDQLPLYLAWLPYLVTT